MLPSTYRPKTIQQFIGPAQAKAAWLVRLADKIKASRDPARVAFFGKPGIGKSALADFLAQQLGANKWSTYEKNGTSFRIEDVEEWTRTMHGTDLFSPIRVFRIEEVDKVSNAAQVGLLTLLDRLPPGNVFIVTTNKSPSELEARFQRRFLAVELEAPSADEIAQFLMHQFQVVAGAAHSIAASAVLGEGFLGQALNDADAYYAAAAQVACDPVEVADCTAGI